jgi:hypothetical protein
LSCGKEAHGVTSASLRPRLWYLVVVTAVGLPGTLAAGDANDTQGEGGIWKAVVPPPGAMHGGFDSNDPVGLTAGARIKADCSINWVDPDEGQLYCFSSATSLEVFLDAPRAYLERARVQWRRLGGSG